MALRYGIVQGRLSPQVGDFIQNFPDDWREEFRIAQRVGASHIEWIDGAPNVAAGNKYLWEARDHQLEVPISGVCLDWLVSTRHTTTHDRLIDGLMFAMMAEEAEEMRIGRLVLPLLEGASMDAARQLDETLYKEVIQNLGFMADEYPGVVFSIETDLDASDMQDLLKALDLRENIRVTFDMGNLTKKGYDLRRHVAAYGPYIDNVHIKDCRVGGTTVPLGTGDTDLSVMRHLIKLPNIRHFTFQTARNQGLSEEDVFRYNVDTIERVLNVS